MAGDKYIPGGSEIRVAGVCAEGVSDFCRQYEKERDHKSLHIRDSAQAGYAAFDGYDGKDRTGYHDRESQHGPELSGLYYRRDGRIRGGDSGVDQRCTAQEI